MGQNSDATAPWYHGDMTDSTDDHAARHALESASNESAEIDILLIKLATSGLGFILAVDAYREGQLSSWLVTSGFFLLGCIAVVLLSKYTSVWANLAFNRSITHKDPTTRLTSKKSAELGNCGVTVLNWAGGILFIMGALLVALHVAIG